MLRLNLPRIQKVSVLLNMKVLQTVLLLGLASGLTPQTTPLAQHAPTVRKSERTPELKLQGSIVRIPIVMVREYPFLEGEIAGVKGKLMLDASLWSELVITLPSLAPSCKRMVDRLVEGLSNDNGRSLWRLQVQLRTFA